MTELGEFQAVVVNASDVDWDRAVSVDVQQPAYGRWQIWDGEKWMPIQAQDQHAPICVPVSVRAVPVAVDGPCRTMRVTLRCLEVRMHVNVRPGHVERVQAEVARDFVGALEREITKQITEALKESSKDALAPVPG